MLAVALSLVLLLGTALIRNTPQSVGLQPDGDGPTSVELEAAYEKQPSMAAADDELGGPVDTPAHAAPLEARTLREAAAHPLLWCLISVNVAYSVFWAGFNFSFLSYLASLGGELGRLSAPRTARALFLPLSVSQNATKLLIDEAQAGRRGAPAHRGRRGRRS